MSSGWSIASVEPHSFGGLFSTTCRRILATNADRAIWYEFPLEPKPEDWADCLSGASMILGGSPPPTFFLLIEGQTERLLLDFLRFLRLSKYHPRAWTSAKYELWRSPALCFSFESRETLIEREPEALVLFSPSVRFYRLPVTLYQGWLGEAIKIPLAEESELARYVNATTPVNFSSHHTSADPIGSYAFLKYLGRKGALSNKPVRTAELHEMFWQLEQGKDDDWNEGRRESVATMVAASRRLAAQSQSRVLVIDDEINQWKPVWDSILGPENETWLRRDQAQLHRDIKGASGGVATSDPLRIFSLVILDLWLEPRLDSGTDLKELSGFRILRMIRSIDESIPVLIFTSSRRWLLLNDLRRSGADSVCIKPVRLDRAPDQIEYLLGELRILLRPEYLFLRRQFYDLNRQRREFRSGADKHEPIEWALSSWREAHHNLRSWISQPHTETVRLSGLSVARTAGLVQEYLTNKYGQDATIYDQARSNPRLHALRYIRNLASHFIPAQDLAVTVGLVAIGLAAKLLSGLNDDLVPRQTSAVLYINCPSDDELQLLRFSAGVGPVISDRLRGAIQVSSVAFLIRKHSTRMQLDDIVEYLWDIEVQSNNLIRRLCSENGIQYGDLALALQGVDSNGRWWLNGLDKWFAGLSVQSKGSASLAAPRLLDT